MYLNQKLGRENRGANKRERENRIRNKKKKETKREGEMDLGNFEDDLRLVVDGDEFDSSSSSPSSSSSAVLCRICHEEEDESSTSMESPCACSGTLKFAHRECIQRWCDEKGSTVCEICLQKFEPGYTVPPKLALLDIAVTIRGSLEVPRLNYETEDTGDIDDESDSDYPECSPPSDNRSAIWFRSIALICMLILLARHLIVLVSAGEGNYPFALATVLLLRASGIVLPFYFMMKVAEAIQKGQRQHQRRLRLQFHNRRGASPVHRDEEDELLQQDTVIQVHP